MSTQTLVIAGIFVLLLAGAVILTFRVGARASKSYDKARERRERAGPSVPCSTCKSSMEFAGVQEFLVASSEDSGLGQTGGKLPLEIYRCPTCRKIETFLPPSAG